LTIGCASGRAKGCVAAAAIASPSRSAAAAAAPHAAQRRKRVVDLRRRRADARVRLEDRREELGLQRSRQVEPFDARDDPVDRRDLLEGLGVEDHQLLLDAQRERRRLAEPLLDHCALTP
jgi:hypothetical protein